MLTRALLGLLPEDAAGDLLEEAASRGSAWLWWQALRSLWWSGRADIVPAVVASLAGVLLPVLALDRLWAFVYSQIPLRGGLVREPWMLAVNVGVAGVLCGVLRRRGTALLMPVAGAAGWLLGIADAGLWYGLPLVGVCLIAGRRWRV